MKTLHVFAGAIATLALGAGTVVADPQKPKVIDVKVGTVVDLDGDGRAVDPSGIADEPPSVPPQDHPAAPTGPRGSGEDCNDEHRTADDCTK
jgi:hypothetical protein